MSAQIHQDSAKIGVLIRTKDRPLCLKRALASLAKQSFKNFQIYILNDGGNANITEGVVASFPQEAFIYPIKIMHNPAAKGRGHAASALIEQATEPFLHLHDDDDTIEPLFFEKTVSFLEMPSHQKFVGVVVSNYDVIERYDNDLTIISRTDQTGKRHAPYTDLISFLSRDNVIIPIALLFRRSAVEKSGNINPEFDYLEDYDLFLRLLIQGDFGTITETLASYHHRENTDTAYDSARTITSQKDSHNFFNEKIRQAILDNDETSKFFAIAMMQKHNREHITSKITAQNNFMLDVMKNLHGQYTIMMAKMRILEDKIIQLSEEKNNKEL